MDDAIGDDAGRMQPADMPLDSPAVVLTVLYEDGRLLVVNKPAGLVTHPAYKHPSGTLCDLVFARQVESGEARPWLLHRLDRETSGVVLFANTAEARRAIVRQFERRTIRKRYLAIVTGRLASRTGVIDAPLRRDPSDRRRTIVDAEGQPATTRYRVLAEHAGYALVLAEPLTGRTHQIRAHLAHVGAPIVGDLRYRATERASQPPVLRAMLHAWRLHLMYPGTGVPFMVSAPLPQDFLALASQAGLDASLHHLSDVT